MEFVWITEPHLSGRQALDAIPRNPPCAILMEVDLPDMSGIECARRLKVLLPALPIVMHTIRSDGATVLLSILGGAVGYLVKPASPEGTVDALVRAMQGAAALCAQAQNSLVQGLRKAAQAPPPGHLTRQERAVVGALTQGLRDKEIASLLGISARTAQAHLLSVYRKLGAHGREEARLILMGLFCGTGTLEPSEAAHSPLGNK
jgi:DNA-binding NarL/FixJ family response regulator